ncbi:MAG: cytochrome-c peroxidase [Candidatus Wallbacteria bacterium]|nr:cytochrome-c peroxidase [Candidatus Wallbacteria bacterium]
MIARLSVAVGVGLAVLGWSTALAEPPAAPAASAPTLERLEKANPVAPIPASPLGIERKLAELPKPPEPERVRLGRWLFFDKRLSADNTVACATCHVPDDGFSQPTPVSTGIGGQKGKRKAPSFLNAAFAFFPETFWDGRASSLEDQASGPMANPIEMGNTHEVVVKTVAGNANYRAFFKKAFGDEKVTLERITKAIADYERTRLSGNSQWDRWKAGDQKAVGDAAKKGDELFFGKANCSRCHVGIAFTDSRFHNLGIGWDEAKKDFADKGRFAITSKSEDLGAFKTPGLRETALHAPYMHDGSLATLQDVVAHYRKGGTKNPHLSPKMEPLPLTDDEANSLVELMKALNGEGYQDSAPAVFP